MKTARFSLPACLALAYALPAIAETPEVVSIPATPIGSPGSWLDSDDYPAVALRYNMSGTTAFRLTVDGTGKPSRCDIVASSGFDVLDAATCQRMMANAHFSSPRNREGKPVEGTFASRVVWAIPKGATHPVTETFGSMLLSIDQAGNVTSCRMVLHVPAMAPVSAEQPCQQGMGIPPAAFGLELRGNYQGSSAEVEIQQADVFTPELRARILAPMPGYEQRGLNIYHFTVSKDGKLGQCSYAEQRGNEHLTTDYCGTIRDKSFDPPFSAFDKDGLASGWHIVRMLLKTGN